MSDENWYPSEEEYTPNLSKDDWLELLQDEKIFDYNSMCMMRRLKDIGGQATCKQLADKYGKTPSAYVGIVSALTKRIQQKAKCTEPPQRENGNERRWPILFLGKWDKDNIHYIWKLRPELSAALDEIDLTKYELYEGKEVSKTEKIKNLITQYKVALANNQEVAFDAEKYKWELITKCKNLSPLDIVKNAYKTNLIDVPRVNPVIKKFLEDKKDGFENVLNNLFDENVDLENRLAEYKAALVELGAEYNFGVKANDERTASCFLACHNPQKYTFYKDSFYQSLCKYLGIESKVAGKKFAHYLELISELSEAVENDSALMQKMSQLSEGLLQSTYLISQNIVYVLFEQKLITQGDATMPNPNEKIISLMDLLEANKNLILHGAPGTGKTHTAKDIAAQMICGKSYAEVEKDEALNKQFNEQTEFVQFHPSYDYSDFVEGLRPIEGDNDGDVGFERKDGVFKEFCKRALKANYNDGVDNFDEAWEKLFEYLNENDFIDVQLLSGKNNFLVELNEYGDGLANRTYENDAFEKGNWIKGQSKFFSKEQLYNIYKGLKGVPKGGHDNYRKAVVAKMKSDFGLKDYKVGTETDKKKNFIFIIDEINRGEMSKIFGELFFSIDPDYRGTKGKVRTQYANMLEDSNDFDDALGITTSYGHFFVPENVYIIGTMNDIDRSVDSMDFAMRRRFTFMELKANECLAMLEDLQLSNDISKEDIIAKMTALNSEIEKIQGLSSAYHIGGSYFAKLSKYADKPKDEAYKCLWNNHLKPLLTDYLRGLPNLEAKLSSFKTKYDEAEFVAPKNSDD